MPDLTGRTLRNRYRILGFIGRGDVGEVYRAYDNERGRHVVLKVLNEALAEDKVLLGRFEEHAPDLRNLDHASIVHFYDLKRDSGLTFFCSEYVRGRDLREHLAELDRPMTLRETLSVLDPVCRALAFAQDQGVAHRNVKPANILLEQDGGRVLLSDFGLGEMAGAGAGTGAAKACAYTAPESFTGGSADARSDIYSLGVCLFEMLTGGERPFSGETAPTGGKPGDRANWQHLNQAPSSPQKYHPAIPKEVADVVLKCLAKRPEDRFQDAIELLQAFRDACPGLAGNPPSVMVVEPRFGPGIDRGSAKTTLKVAGGTAVTSGQAGACGVHLTPGAWAVLGVAAIGLLLAAGLALRATGRMTDASETTAFAERQARATQRAAAHATGTARAESTTFALSTKLVGVTATPLPSTVPSATQQTQPTLTVAAPAATEEALATPTATVTESETPAAPTLTPVPATDIPAPSPTPMPPTSTSTPSVPGPGQMQTRPADGMTMVFVPVGEFLMGSTEGEGEAAEHPQHTVYLDAFWIDRTEVTNAQFVTFVQATGHQTDAERNGGGDVFTTTWWEQVGGADWRHPSGPGSSIGDKMAYPVVQVSWNDANAYCQWAGARLPTEAEWEKAARGTDGRAFPWGNQTATCDYAVMGGETGNGCGFGNGPFAVGSKPAGAGPYGALDMAGSVWEWVGDWFAEDFYAGSPSANPIGPGMGSERGRRGGSWYNSTANVRSAGRNRSSPAVATDDIGFRCASSLAY